MLDSERIERSGDKVLKTVTKKDLARTVAQAVSSRNNTAQEAVDALFIAMREELIKGNRIEIRGFGVLDVKNKRPANLDFEDI